MNLVLKLQFCFKNSFALVVKCLPSAQRYFTRVIIRRFLGHTSSALPPYQVRCRMLSLLSLEDRRTTAQAIFVGRLLLCEIDSPDLLSRIPMYIPSRILRPREFLSIPYRRTRYGASDPFLLCQRQFNVFYYCFDFHCSSTTFRRLITESFWFFFFLYLHSAMFHCALFRFLFVGLLFVN